ncbi:MULTISPECIES: excinuclease ABC subunit UvrC [unclassified Oceanobacter]|jgi:excinuclease ABC subunit C|uniref:excinuclease ABC subunit UvrC n=1 Tax=unclassified Oceanobacter TaxID=2620260 RepID=UPI0026E1483E|nr:MULTISPECIES: excinuclease ABC subunit UvrC [unclassified Oceanobacter]MDO6681099.1 excinuclease ABC subunit UvrC [Oceanobacter sp. 5_MG-2023]MDP2504329.1 excinuclease ABC subunit UvrC [Oceanobacter sp. 3_MG-2023]
MTEFDIPAFLKTLTQRAGVYRMYSVDQQLLYVGKAKNLKNRVASYFRSRGLNSKTVALVSGIHHIEVTVTASEAEALLLEQTLIKQHRPPYNILLKDDKSYPYLHLSAHAFPLLAYRRGKRVSRDGRSGQYFGPYPNSGAVREALNYLQRLFLLRSCEDSYFNHRSRPCLQYEIKRCSAPCVGLVSEASYQRDIQHAVLFLNGENQQLMRNLQQQMLDASAELDFERAADIRDRIELLRRVQEKQRVDSGNKDADVWALWETEDIVCLHRLVFRQGRLVSSKNYYPDNPAGEQPQDLLLGYIGQFYLSGFAVEGLPTELVVDVDPADMAVVQEAVRLRFERTVRHSRGVRGELRQWRAMADDNARAGAQTRISGHQLAHKKLACVADLLGLPKPPERIECFDISHAQGEATYASCVVFDREGLAKQRYRRFSIRGVTPGDDYAALEQAITRHLTRLKEQNDLPDVLMVDGGKGQVARIEQVLSNLEISTVALWGISKGETRKSGWEFLWEAGALQPIIPDAHDDGFRLLQWVRDESHRFAITGHRKARAKSRSQSELDNLQGVGPKRRRALLLHFGSLKNMRGAPREEIARVPGVSQKLADQIFVQLHGE